LRLKSAYRTKVPAETPDIPERVQPSETTHIEFIDKTDPDKRTIASIDTAIPEPDEATLTLQKQIADLKKSEQMQREFAQHVAAQRAAQMAAPEPALPSDPEARIALWRTQGLSDHDADFISEHLELAVEPHLTRIASDEAAQHYERDTDAHRAATLEAFHRLQGQQAQAQPAPAATPEFFRPPPAPSPTRAEPSAMYSAPVSRQAPSAGYRETNPRQTKLSVEEQQVARASGISDVQYAQNKLRMLRERASGQRE
jgi:hypothetical protein